MLTLGCSLFLLMAQPAPQPPAAPTKAVKPAEAKKPTAKTPAEAKKPTAKTPAEAKKPTANKPVKKKAAAKAAKGPTVDTVVRRVQAYYARMKDYSAEFIQTYEKVALSQQRELRGLFQLKRPRQARWLYRDPEKVWVINGRKMTVLDPELEQAFIDDNFESAEISRSISFLWGSGRLDEAFKATLGDRKAYGFRADRLALELVPLQGATYRKLVLGVDPKTGEVTDSILFETAGNTNRFQFINAKLNTGLKATLFEAKPPPEWEVIQQ